MSISESDSGALGFLTSNVVVSKLRDAYNGYAERREALGLPNPGTIENIAKEVQRDVFLNNLSFTGLRAELNKTCSVSPIFQVSHSLATGSQMLPPYTFATMYGSPKVRRQTFIAASDASLTSHGIAGLSPR
jgi:mitochondrial import receptor subunit TOM40